ncbi:MAG: DUF2975 domain-containing protein [Pseudonocardiaceae bacterium]
MKRAHRENWKCSSLASLDGLLLLVMVVAGLVSLLSLVATINSKTVSDLTVGLPATPLRSSLPSGAVLHEVSGVLGVGAGLGYRLAWWAVGPAAAILVAVGARILRAIVATARDGDPFVSANVFRVRVLAGLAAGYFVLTVARAFVSVTIQFDIGLKGVTASLSFLPLVSTVVLLALAEIWQRGVDIRSDQELTV